MRPTEPSARVRCGSSSPTVTWPTPRASGPSNPTPGVTLVTDHHGTGPTSRAADGLDFHFALRSRLRAAPRGRGRRLGLARHGDHRQPLALRRRRAPGPRRGPRRHSRGPEGPLNTLSRRDWLHFLAAFLAGRLAAFLRAGRLARLLRRSLLGRSLLLAAGRLAAFFGRSLLRGQPSWRQPSWRGPSSSLPSWLGPSWPQPSSSRLVPLSLLGTQR